MRTPARNGIAETHYWRSTEPKQLVYRSMPETLRVSYSLLRKMPTAYAATAASKTAFFTLRLASSASS